MAPGRNHVPVGWAMPIPAIWASWPVSLRVFSAPWRVAPRPSLTSFPVIMSSTRRLSWAGMWVLAKLKSPKLSIAHRVKSIRWRCRNSVILSIRMCKNIRPTVSSGNPRPFCEMAGVIIYSSICSICCPLWSIPYQRSCFPLACHSTRKFWRDGTKAMWGIN